MTASMQRQDPIGNIVSLLARSTEADMANVLNVFLQPHTVAAKAEPK